MRVPQSDANVGIGTLEHVSFISTQAFVMSADSICGTAGLPLPNGEREQAVLGACP
jgi:hypothetical protein